MTFGCTAACRAAVSNQCHCTGCHNTFRHLGDFEGHRRGPIDSRACLDPSEMGLQEVNKIWASPESHEQARVVVARMADSRTATRTQERLNAPGVPTPLGRVS